MPKTNLVNPWTAKDAQFTKNIKAGIARQGKTYKDLAAKAAVSEQTVYARYKRPETMTVKEFRAFIEVAKINENEILDLLIKNY
ncbi:MAG: transposase family protein [Lachnospiraceae bacterium]|nr:transposase family protein [Lachnospiraceae bacterium]